MIRYIKLRSGSIISLKDLYFVDIEENTLYLTYISKSGKEYTYEVDYSDLKEDINSEKTNIESDYDLLLEELEGKTIKLIITCPYNRFSGYVEDIRIGYRQSFTMELFETNFPYLAWSFFLLISSLVLLLSTFLFVKSYDEIKRMASLLGAVATLSLAVVAESQIINVYVEGYVNGLTYISLIIFVSCFIYYMRRSIVKKTYRVILLVLYILSCIHLIAAPTLHMLKMFDLFESLNITIILLIVTMAIFAIYKIHQIVDVSKTSKVGWKAIFEGSIGVFTFLSFGVAMLISYAKIYYYIIPCSLLLVYIFYRYGSSIRGVISDATKSIEYKAQLKETKNYLIQSQMKSHFIFNTLGAIRTMIVSQPNTAYNMMTDFTKYLRANISNISPNEQIPFSQELDHIKAYANIEKQRFQNRLEVVYDIKCTNFVIPPLSVEPLVENAVKHGVCKRVEGGTVRIATKETDDKYIVTVSDDGVGFDPAILDDESKKGSVGLKYIKIRLETLAHAEFTIQSIPGKGTIAMISINKNK